MRSHNSLTNFFSASHGFDLDSLRMALRDTPLSRTNFYIETKSIQGFKENLQEEIKDLLIELHCSEETLQKVIKVFLLFIDRHEKVIYDKDDQILNVLGENERLMMKLSLEQRAQDPLVLENMDLLEKTAELTDKIDMLDRQCQRYEEKIEEIQASNMRASGYRISQLIFDINKEFVQNYEKLKQNFPNYFCKCLGEYQEIKDQNYQLRERNAKLMQDNEEIKQGQTFLNKRLETLEYNQKLLSHENQRLKAELVKMEEAKQQLITQLEPTPNRRRYFRLRSHSIDKKNEDSKLNDFENDKKSTRIQKIQKCQSVGRRAVKEITILDEPDDYDVRKSPKKHEKKLTLLSELKGSIEEIQQHPGKDVSPNHFQSLFEHFESNRMITPVAKSAEMLKMNFKYSSKEKNRLLTLEKIEEKLNFINSIEDPPIKIPVYDQGFNRSPFEEVFGYKRTGSEENKYYLQRINSMDTPISKKKTRSVFRIDFEKKSDEMQGNQGNPLKDMEISSFSKKIIDYKNSVNSEKNPNGRDINKNERGMNKSKRFWVIMSGLMILCHGRLLYRLSTRLAKVLGLLK